MILWTDAQLSPRIARWTTANFPHAQAFPLRDLDLREAEDEQIFAAARLAKAVVLTKDSDFVQLLERRGSPPKILWLTCGNTSNAVLQQLFTRRFATALGLLESSEIWSRSAPHNIRAPSCITGLRQSQQPHSGISLIAFGSTICRPSRVCRNFADIAYA